MTEPPNDPWENAPRMTPEQQGPPPPPGSWGAAPPPPGSWGAPPQQGAPYGAPPGYAPPGYYQQRAPSNGLGIAALVLGIVGFFLSFVVIGGLLGIAAIGLGIAGLGRVRRREATNGGVAIGGIVTGGIAVLIAAVVLIVVIAFGDEFNSLTDCLQSAQTQQEIDNCQHEFENNFGD